MQRDDWIAHTWDRVVNTRFERVDEFHAAVDVWSHTCEIILAKAMRKHHGEKWDNRRVKVQQ